MTVPGATMRAVRWTPPANPRPVRRRGDVRTLPPLSLVPMPAPGPEHIAIDAAGTLFAGLADGRIVRTAPDGTVDTLATSGGRPLGVELLGDDALVVCDAYRGLLRVALADGTVDVLCDTVDGEKLNLCSNAAVGRDGEVYFTQSSRRYDLEHYKGDLIEHSATGRLFRYRDGVVEVIAEGFAFANGVVLVDDEASAIVAETGAYRLTKVRLSGSTTGEKSTFTDELPGFPDNLTQDAEGLIWIGMASPRDPLLEWLLPRHPRLRKAVWALPSWLQPGPMPVAWAMAVDQKGAVVHDLRGWKVGYKAVTAARRHGARLCLGSLVEPAVAVVDFP